MPLPTESPQKLPIPTMADSSWPNPTTIKPARRLTFDATCAAITPPPLAALPAASLLSQRLSNASFSLTRIPGPMFQPSFATPLWDDDSGNDGLRTPDTPLTLTSSPQSIKSTPIHSPLHFSIMANTNVRTRPLPTLLPSSPLHLAVPDFTVHDAVLRQSPLRLTKQARMCPQTPTRMPKRKRSDERQMFNDRTLFFLDECRVNDNGGGNSNDSRDSITVHHSRSSSMDGDDSSEEIDSGIESPTMPSLTPSTLTLPSSSALSLSLIHALPQVRERDFVFEEPIGEGSFSEVWRVRVRSVTEKQTHSILGSLQRSASLVEIEKCAELFSPSNAVKLSSAHAPSQSSQTQFAIKRSKQSYATISEHRRVLRQMRYLTRLRHSQAFQLINTHATSDSDSDYDNHHKRRLVSANTQTHTNTAVNSHWPSRILRHHCVWQERGLLFAQTDLHSNGDLKKFFQCQRSESHCWTILYDIGTALRTLQCAQLLHFDVKPSNILVDDDNRFVLADLGNLIDLANKQDDDSEGDGQWLAPEVLSFGKSMIDTPVDCFALGATLYSCITGLLLKINGQLSIDWESAAFPLSAELQRLIESMVNEDPARRPTFSTIVALAKQKLAEAKTFAQ